MQKRITSRNLKLVAAEPPRIGDGPFAGLYAGHYQTLMVDPPWRFLTRSNKGLGRAPQRHYDCMSMAELKALPVADLAAPSAILHLWAIDPMLPQALELIDAWGFTFKSVSFAWVKTNPRVDIAKPFTTRDFAMTLGYWTRANAELCLLATRGRPKRLSKSVRRLIVSPRRKHSQKPDEAFERVMALTGGPYLELFSRTNRPGWTSWGKETGKIALDDKAIAA